MLTTTYINNDLQQISFLEFLEICRQKIDGIIYNKNSEESYFKSKELIRSIIRRFMKEFRGQPSEFKKYSPEGETLFRMESLLHQYSTFQNNKQKKLVIEEFKSKLKEDLLQMISSRKFI